MRNILSLSSRQTTTSTTTSTTTRTLPVAEVGRDPCCPTLDPGWPSGCSIVNPAAPTAGAASGAPHPLPPLLPPLLAGIPLPLGEAEAGGAAAAVATPLSAATVAHDLASEA